MNYKHEQEIPIFKRILTVIVTDDLDPIIKKYGLKRQFKGSIPIAFAINLHDGEYVIVLTTYADAGYIAHECKHILNYVWQDIGQKLDADNDEVEGYFLGWLVDAATEVQRIGRKHIRQTAKNSRQKVVKRFGK